MKLASRLRTGRFTRFAAATAGTGLVGLTLALVIVPTAHAATDPSLGAAASFGVLASTFTNTNGAATTTISGSVGYTTGPTHPPTVNGGGVTYTVGPVYSAAGTAQLAASTLLNAATCTNPSAPGTVYNGTLLPGVYCITGAQSIGAGITLQGAGTYIFQSTGALNTTANSTMALSLGANACDVFWVPGGGTTLGANSTFAGTVIDGSAITAQSEVTWTGRALAAAGTVTTDSDTINVPSCSLPATPPTPTTTSCSVTSSANPSTVGQSVTFTVSVTGSNPTGSVTFSNNAVTAGTGVLTNGQASFTTTSLGVGANSFLFTYGGDGTNLPCQSVALAQTVNQVTTTATTTPAGATASVTTPVAATITTTPKPSVATKKSTVSGTTKSGATAGAGTSGTGSANTSSTSVPGATSTPIAPTSTISSTVVPVTG